MAMHTAWINHSSTQMTQASLDSSSQGIQDIALHQLLFSLPFRPADRIVCLWTPFFQETSLQQGHKNEPTQPISFVTIPGSHKSSELLTIDSEETVIYEPLPRVVDSTSVRKQLALTAGDVVLYHPLLRHATLSSSATLGSLSTFYASSECQYIEYLSGRSDSLIPDHLKDIGNMPVTPEVMNFVTEPCHFSLDYNPPL